MEVFGWLKWTAEEWATMTLMACPNGIVPQKLKRSHAIMTEMFRACHNAGYIAGQDSVTEGEKEEQTDGP